MHMDSQQQQNVIPMPKNLDFLDKDKKGARDQDMEIKIVWPWMGILMNVNYEQNAKNGKKNCQDNKGKSIYIPAWDTDVKSHFAYLNPRGVQAIWNQGLAVLDFGLGYFDAQDFEKGFAQCKRGKREFENMTKHRKERAQEMFGWMVDESDFNQMNCVGEILRKKGALRAKPRFCEAWTEQHDILLEDVRSKLQEKNMKLMQLGKEVCNLQTLVYQSENEEYSTEAQFLLKERKHKEGTHVLTSLV